MTAARLRHRIWAVVTAAVLATGLATAVAVDDTAAGASSGLGSFVDFGCANPLNHLSEHLLPAARTSVKQGMRCFGTMRPSDSGGPSGLTPYDIRHAYGLYGTKAHGRTVAIVDAYDDPNVESDLAVYRSTFHLPACTTANGCFRKVNQDGNASPLPQPDYGWSEEITLDVDAVSAACPDCHILLVEANTPDTTPLMTGVNTAVRLGASAISNSYGGDEDNTIRGFDKKYLRHPGVAITASSGDNGYGVSWPASSPYVTAVGGTTLQPASNARGWQESAWSGAGSGCSKYEPKPSWQHDTGCRNRTVADVSADADPNTGLAVYGTYNDCLLAALCNDPVGGVGGQGLNGWAQVGGTSLSSPLVASVYALAGRKVTYGSYPYLHAKRGSLFDVIGGSNGNCSPGYLCTAVRGYDGPTGRGTPNGLGAF